MSVLQAATRVVRPLVIMLAATALLLPAAPARGQIGELAGFGEAMQREYLSRDLTIFEEGLELDQAQRDILKNLFDDYKNDFEAGLKRMQQQLQDMKEQLQNSTDRSQILSMIFVPFEDWAEERAKLGDNFLSSVKTILNQQQLEQWPSFERRLLRDKTLSKGVLSGESLNLLLVLREIGLPKAVEDQIRPVVREYEIALDQVLRRRNEVVRRSQAQMIRALQEQDPQATLKLADDQLDQHVKVREVNDLYIDRITAALPPEHSMRFFRQAMERAYPQAYRPTAGERMYQSAAGLDSIDPATMENVVALLDAYRAELDAMASDVVTAIRRHEPAQKRYRVELYAARLAKEEPMNRKPDPVLEKLRDRDELDDRFVSILQGLLSGEQFAALPGSERWLQRQDRSRIRAAALEREKIEERTRLEKSAGTPKPNRSEQKRRAGGVGG